MVDLGTLTITNFRSIRGTISVPLTAPVTLLHGPNGSGKTSVLSALELALTGEVLGLENIKPKHLVHRLAPEARISLSADGSERLTAIQGSRVSADAALSGEDRRFFSERCYLGQAALGRLLDVYQATDAGPDSALTHFVRDLLKLDELDAVIDGLHVVSHLARVKRDVPSFGAAEARIAALSESVEALTGQRSDLTAAHGERLESIASLVATLDDAPDWDPSGRVDQPLMAWLRAQQFEARLTELAGHRRETASAIERVAQLGSRGGETMERLEREQSAKNTELNSWRTNSGAAIEDAIKSIQSVLPDVSSSTTREPADAVSAAQERAQAEISRLSDLVSTEGTRQERLDELARAIAACDSRISAIDEQIQGAAPSSRIEALAASLASLSGHIDSEECPVCGRDFGEISVKSLSAHVADEVSRLSDTATRLQSLSRARLGATEDRESLEGERRRLGAGTVSARELARSGASLHQLEEAVRKLAASAADAAEGSRLLAAAQRTESALALARERDWTNAELRRLATSLAAQLSLPAVPTEETTRHALTRMHESVVAETQRVQREQTACDNLEQLWHELGEIRDELAAVELDLLGTREQLGLAREAMNALDDARTAMRSLRTAAIEARANVVRGALNDALNRVWRDLFVRLAPSEPFVPAFKLPDHASESITAELHTLHRDGGEAGGPGAMLSAGNLNTAALTLFLALHLSTQDRLPLLVLDDPVQSMDEIHVAQFAALLKTLSKQLNRRVVIAVHERALFDYLALELSPAVPGEHLTTVELRRTFEGDTRAVSRHHSYETEPAITAA